MKKILFTSIVIILFLVTSLVIALSTIGLETEKFNKLISDKVIKSNRGISLKLESVKFKFSFKNFNLFLETKNPSIKYKDLDIPIEKVKVYLDFSSLITSKFKIDKIDLSSKEINIDQLKKIIIKTKPSNLNSLITNRIKNGQLMVNLEIFFNDNLEINNFIAKGEVKKMNGVINNELSLENTSFNFFADSTDVLIKNLRTRMDGLLLKSGNLQITKDKEIILKSDFNTEIDLNKKNIINYLSLFKNNKFINNQTNLSANFENFLNITFDKTFKVTDYVYTNKGKINRSLLKFNESIKNPVLEKDINFLNFKDSNINVRYASDKKNYIYASGKYSTDSKNYQNYDLKNDVLNKTSNINLEFEFTDKIIIDLINYKKDHSRMAKILLNIKSKKDSIHLNKLDYSEGKNKIIVEKLRISKKDIISLKKIKVKTFKKNDLKNDFVIDFGKKIKIFGNQYDAKNLNKFLNKKNDNNIFKKINKDIEIDLKNIDTPLAEKLKKFRLIGTIEKGKFIKISSKGDFGNNDFLDISMKNDKKNKKKYLEVYSDLPQPLLSEYSFFKGLSGGILTFSSIIESNSSTSILVIDNFKLVNAPGVVRLLSLADFGGLADLAEGEGLSFEKMEINMSTKKGFIKLDELYAVGPSISVLMEGYKEANGLTSLRGTLIPAKNLNKLLSKIPVIGNIIIPKEIGEGLFGVSFKIKGLPGEMKTSINPIKTLTPRFITKALEKQKKTK